MTAAAAGGTGSGTGRDYRSSEERRDEIVGATLSILVEEGVRAWTTAELARRVGVSEATLFKHFDDKDEILAEAVRRQAAELRRRIEDGAGSDGHGWRAVERLVGDILEHLEATGGGPLLVLLGRADRLLPEARAELRETRERLRARVAGILRRGSASPTDDASPDPEAVADLVIAVVQSSALRWLMGGRSTGLATVARPMLDVVAGCLERSGEAADPG